MDNFVITPTESIFNKANNFIKILDQTKNNLSSNNVIVSKVAKDLKTIKPPVLRYFESPGQISSYYGDGEFDIVSIFKLLKHESYFQKSIDKKLSLSTKSGFSIISDDDDVNDYFNKRFLLMQLQTKKSLNTIIKQTLLYLFVCRNAFIVKVRDPNFQYAKSYSMDNKEKHPVVGLFTVHPTMMKPKFKYVKESGMWKAVLDKWVNTNKRGQIKEFDVDDVVHFTINREDGYLFAFPDVLPVIDDIRTLRKIEEDIQLLIYRDLFPIIHYTIESPRIIDHGQKYTELDQARYDMQKIVQDGGIATDKRHEIKFVGNEGKSLDVSKYLEYFQQRVFSGLGVSAIDMSIAGQANVGDAEGVSKQLIDLVKYVQQELAEQFKENVLIEMALQSPFDNILDKGIMPEFKFEEVDLEWKIRYENHEADLYTKNTKTIHEIRNNRGEKTLSDDDLMYTHGALYGDVPTKTKLDTGYGDALVQHEGKLAHATTVETTTTTSQAGSPPKKTHTKPVAGKTTQSAATKDPIKSSGTNSNIVKRKIKDSLQDSLSANSLKEEFVSVISKLQDNNKANKLNIVFATKYIYDKIKEDMIDSIKIGMQQAANDLSLEDYDTRIQHNIFESLDKLRDDLADKLYNDPAYLNKAANRIAITDKTESIRALNYGYALTAINNKHSKFKIVSDSDILSQESSELLGTELELNNNNILEKIPPFKPNSSLMIKVVTGEQVNGEEE